MRKLDKLEYRKKILQLTREGEGFNDVDKLMEEFKKIPVPEGGKWEYEHVMSFLIFLKGIKDNK